METILLILCYYVAITMIASLLSGFFNNPIWSFLAVVWPVGIIVIIGVLFVWVLSWFYKFGEMTGNLFK